MVEEEEGGEAAAGVTVDSRVVDMEITPISTIAEVDLHLPLESRAALHRIRQQWQARQSSVTPERKPQLL